MINIINICYNYKIFFNILFYLFTITFIENVKNIENRFFFLIIDLMIIYLVDNQHFRFLILKFLTY